MPNNNFLIPFLLRPQPNYLPNFLSNPIWSQPKRLPGSTPSAPTLFFASLPHSISLLLHGALLPGLSPGAMGLLASPLAWAPPPAPLGLASGRPCPGSLLLGPLPDPHLPLPLSLFDLFSWLCKIFLLYWWCYMQLMHDESWGGEGLWWCSEPRFGYCGLWWSWTARLGWIWGILCITFD